MIRKNKPLKERSIAIIYPINDMKFKYSVKWFIEPFNKNDSRYYDTIENVYGEYLDLKYMSQFRKKTISSYIKNQNQFLTLKNRTRCNKNYPLSYYSFIPHKSFSDI